MPGLALRGRRRAAARLTIAENSTPVSASASSISNHLQIRGVHDGGHLLGDDFHVPVTFGIGRNLILKAHVCSHSGIEVSSFEQSWLRISLFRFAKIAQSDPYKAKALLRTKVYSFSQL